MTECIDHLNFTNGTCPDCNEEVDSYGNTEDQFDNCSFPDCGCDGERLCMAGEASEDARKGNVEGMYQTGSKIESRKAMFYTMGLINKNRETKS